MADYYPLISRAIAGLDPNAPGEARRALYERARSALIAQLRSVDPPLTESEITRERLALEEAVRKVEAEAAQRARDAARERDRARVRAGDALRGRATPKPSEIAAELARSRAETARPATPPRPERPAPPPEEPRPPRVARPSPPPAAETPTPAPRRADDHDGNGVRGFRDVTADVDDLGRAAAQANRSARRTYANVTSPTPEFDRLEPSLENRGEFEGPYDGPFEDAQQLPQPHAPVPIRTRAAEERPTRRVKPVGRFPFKAAFAIGVVLLLAGAGIQWGPSAYAYLRGLLRSPAPVAETAKETAPQARPKITDRVGQLSTEQIAQVAQRVVLYDEDPSDPKGKQYVGTVVWRLEPIKGAGQGDVAVRADVEVPERKLKMTMSFRRNTDTSLPASHTAELTFILPPDFAGGSISNVPGILMKSNEQARGTPLAGLAVKVTDGFFLVGLSNVEADRVRNIQLLKERSWFDLPLVYANQRRAIIAIEKGSPGERAFNDAFAAWGG